MTATGPALRVLIVDDEPLARSRLRTVLGDCAEPATVVVAEVGDAVAATERLAHAVVDVVLLDVQMPGLDGMALAQVLARQSEPPAVVFVSAHAEHALKAFEVEAVDYLTKPVRLERLRQALLKVERRIQQSRRPEAFLTQEMLLIQDRGHALRLPLHEVLFLRAELKYVTVHARGRDYLMDTSLLELEQRHGTHLLRVHRNALVARHALRALERQPGREGDEAGEGWAVRLDGVDELLPVSRRQLAAVRSELLLRT